MNPIDAVVEARNAERAAFLEANPEVANQMAEQVAEEEQAAAATNENENNEATEEDKLFFESVEKKFGKKYEEIDNIIKNPRKDFEQEFFEKYKITPDEAEAKMKAETTFADERLKKANDFIKAGGTMDEWDNLTKTDWEKVNPIDGLKKSIKDENPDMDDREINFLFNRKYKVPQPLDPNNYSQEEVDARQDEIDSANVAIKADWSKIKKERLKFQSESLVAPIKNREQEEAQRGEILKKAKEIENSILNKFSANKGVKVDVKDGEVAKSFSFDLTTEQEKEAEFIIKNGGNIARLFVDEVGNFNENDYIEAVKFVVARKHLPEALMKDYASEVLNEDFSKRKNENFSKGKPNYEQQGSKRERVLDEFMAQQARTR
jgi:hypothetical protein